MRNSYLPSQDTKCLLAVFEDANVDQRLQVASDLALLFSPNNLELNIYCLHPLCH